MSYKLRVLPKARKELDRLPSKDKTLVEKRILALAENPRPVGCKPLAGELAGLFRVRVGDYRIIYQIQDDMLVVLVIRVRHRKNAYR